MMKKNILLVALACAALSFVGCDDDLDFGNTQAVEKFFDQEVNFGGSASYNLADKQNAATRTIYGGYQQGATAEPVYWLSTDQVRLFCNESSIKSADYKVTVAEDETKVTNTGLDKIADAGLRWGNPESQHTFYGVYPIPTDNSLKESTVLTGTIPAVQDYEKYTTSEGSYVFAPNMDYAYMVAKTVIENPNEIGENVFLKFTPIATAVEIELKNNANESGTTYNFREIHLSSSKHNLSGSFTANLDNMAMGDGNNVKYATGCPTGITYGDDVSKQAAVKLYVEGGAVALAPQKTLKFTIFMLPSTSGANDTDAIDDLEITLVTSEGNKTGALTGISIKKSKKSYMHAMPIGADMTYNQSEWIKYVDDDKKLNELSIPGAGGAASGKSYYGATEWTTDEMFLEQELDITQLWNVGIRCFEFTVDCDYVETGGNIADNTVYCNGKACGTTTLEKAVGEVKTLLMEHPEEFAMVIITYQHNDGWGYDRSPDKFQQQLNAFWKNVREGEGETAPYDKWVEGTSTGLYNNMLTVDDARGKLYCISRPSSLGEDNAIVVSSNPVDAVIGSRTHYEVTGLSQKQTSLYVTELDEHILAINGWGALKDKWVSRGYSQCVFYRGTGNNEFKELSGYYAMMGYADGQIGRPVDIQTSSIANGSTLSTLGAKYVETLIDGIEDAGNKELKPNFYYDCQTYDDNELSTKTKGVWAQEWARVSDNDGTFKLQATGKNFWSNEISTTTCYMQWSESMCEKKKRIEETLNYSMNKKIGTEDASNVVFINSLCGYFIDRSEEGTSSAYFNALTDYNAYYEYIRWENRFCVSYLSGQDDKGGMSGDIASFATKVNSYFKELLDTKLNNGRLDGSTGIVLMDRVSNDANDDGAKIPSIIIANNFAPDQNAAGTSYSIRTSNLEDGDAVLSNGYRGVVWGEWEK